MQSPFLSPDGITKDNQLAILHIRRDQSIPTVLAARPNPELNTGYAEGVVTNTRFGSFPHSTLVGLPWGSQVRASLVDTGSRGRKQLRGPAGHKRKAEDFDDDGEDEAGSVLGVEEMAQKEAVAASSGFIHVLPPTPENWTTSLPHRTQVVYTPDYSYILHRIRARPGGILIEAGSGSGSFTHAAARAVFNGYPESVLPSGEIADLPRKKRKLGKVFSYEFHADRFTKVREEMRSHGLDSIVTATERDVYGEGFLITETSSMRKISPSANAIFLDLPAPWQALPHLTRQSSLEGPSPLDPQTTVHICTFSPCVEQAQKTVSALRRHGWLDIEMVDIQQKRIDVRREFTGLEYEGMRGVNAIAADVEQAVARLKAVEQRARLFHTGQTPNSQSKQGKSIEAGKTQEAQRTLYKDGRLVHRTEPELKTHTSYLVFAVLPMEWTDEDEARAWNQWTTQVNQQPAKDSKSHRQMKREAKQKAQGQGQDQPRDSNAEDSLETAIKADETTEVLDMSIDKQ
jgi:tRNA (adenine57-N1/adenine58-N1)-methyltransferase catalytic subunit